MALAFLDRRFFCLQQHDEHVSNSLSCQRILWLLEAALKILFAALIPFLVLSLTSAARSDGADGVLVRNGV